MVTVPPAHSDPFAIAADCRALADAISAVARHDVSVGADGVIVITPFIVGGAVRKLIDRPDVARSEWTGPESGTPYAQFDVTVAGYRVRVIVRAEVAR